MTIRETILRNPWFYALTGITTGLLVAGLILPPPGQIDSSVLTGCGIISFWGVLGVVLRAIEKGVEAKVEHKDTTITVAGKNQ